ncbi:MAG: oxygen-dependent coproporphyrinogen oxidase [Bdellovibrionales bacterium CG10_big_fil_rev_8_21_14_0_10_45_34]|nr:MAG: oxygen-dependent coproporphyrinogen oxidase [Bdellovibrionales bacterium CG10_big_fil_rev_8_21_14_0_10_45_34]
MLNKESIRDYLLSLQDNICQALTDINEAGFQEDHWQRDGGGGGRTRVFSDNGKLLEKGGVNFSEVFGEFSPEFAKTLPKGEGTSFYATGVSLVLHPKNPYVPTVHANYRYLERGGVGWFGGGCDLTPYYPFHEDIVHFHKTYKDALDDFDPVLYPKFKKACDEYFYLPHRLETRGVGGIFFDYEEATNEMYSLVQKLGNQFVPSYLPIASKRLEHSFTEKEKTFQEIRRGRYVEFNLIYDRGTLFGLKTGGRIESILMSLPKHAQWHYSYEPEPNSAEARLKEYLKPTDWLAKLI